MNVSVKDHGEKYATLLPGMLADVTISVRCLGAAVLPAQLVILILGLMKLLLCLQAVQKFGTRSRSFSGSLGFHVPDGWCAHAIHPCRAPCVRGFLKPKQMMDGDKIRICCFVLGQN